MTLSDTYLRLALGTRILPDSAGITGENNLGHDATVLFPAANIAWRARLALNGGSAVVNFAAGTVTPNAAPVAQVDTATVVAAGGCTASGNLVVTITAAAITGSPLALNVPLVTGMHTTAALIADAIRTALAANAAITAQYTVGGAGATVTLTRPLSLSGANDATLNIAIAAGLGVTAAAASANTTAGVAGCTVTRLGGDGKDLHGAALPAATSFQIIAAIADGGNPGAITLGADTCAVLCAGEAFALSGSAVWPHAVANTKTISGTGILDLIVLATA